MSIRRFILNYKGVDYNCEQEVEGKRVFYQSIHVIGFGHEKDSRRYGYGSQYDNPTLMQAHAKIIARSIINKSKLDDQTP